MEGMRAMHKLDRATVPVPACLAEYDHQQHRWDDLTQHHKQEIRQLLGQLQGDRCAYCEGPPYREGHIEHFRRKNPAHFPALTFQWDNLFLACGSQDHCGHYKDRPSAPAYNPDHLIKPDIHDPDEVLYFHSSGEVRLRPNLSDGNAIRANETVRVFNLNEGALKAARRRAVRIYLEREPDILEALILFDPQDRQVFIAEESQATSADPYCTTIKHLFEAVH
jgi:uncharacterized protein (TIGR02646 family)